MKFVKSGIIMDRIVIDILGEFLLIENGNKYILVIFDYFIKWMESFVMLNMEVVIVVRIIVEEVVV